MRRRMRSDRASESVRTVHDAERVAIAGLFSLPSGLADPDITTAQVDIGFERVSLTLAARVASLRQSRDTSR
jgi:hypothetical protein